MKRFIALLLSILFSFCAIPGVSAAAAQEIPTSAIEILQELGAQNPTVIPQTRVSSIGDNLVKNPATAIEFNDTSYAFLNETGEIIRIKRVNEIRTQKNMRNTTSSKFESVDALKTYIENTLIGDEYALVDEYYFSEETLSLRYEKILLSDALDRYDYVSVRINTSLIELETFYKVNSGFQLATNANIIPKEKAIAVANDILGTGEKITDIRLATVKTNNHFKNNVAENDLRLAYMVSTASSVVYVDAYTAEVVGGDIYKAVFIAICKIA